MCLFLGVCVCIWVCVFVFGCVCVCVPGKKQEAIVDARINTLYTLKIQGVFSRGTQSFEDQLDRAGAGSWQIADGGATRK